MVSTIVQPVPDMARKAVELLLKKIKGEEIETLTILPVEFAEEAQPVKGCASFF